jgi:hypothetical protein
VSGSKPKNNEIGQLLNQTMSLFTSQDLSVLEKLVDTNFKDAMMVNNLAKLQMAQIGLTQKVNSVFSQQLNKFITQ